MVIYIPPRERFLCNLTILAKQAFKIETVDLLDSDEDVDDEEVGKEGFYDDDDRRPAAKVETVDLLDSDETSQELDSRDSAKSKVKDLTSKLEALEALTLFI